MMPDPVCTGILSSNLRNRETVKEVIPEVAQTRSRSASPSVANLWNLHYLGRSFVPVFTHEFSLLSKRAVTRTMPGIAEVPGYVGVSGAGGGRN